MRAHAPIAAILALAALSLSPLPLHARKHKPASQAKTQTQSKPHKQTKAHKTAPATTPHAKSQPKAKPKAKPHHTRRSTEDTPDPVTVNRIHAWVASQHPNTRRASARARTKSVPSTTSAALPTPPDNSAATAAAPRQATSADFLKAASAPTSPESDKATSQTPPPAKPARTKPQPQANAVSQPTPVVNVIRTNQDHPQLAPTEEVASTPTILPSLYNKRGRLIVPPPLKGSHEILLRQNQVADREGLDRIQNDDDIDLMRQQHMLVPVPVSPTLVVDERLPANRRYCRPWTAQFLDNLARAHYARFHTPLQINSAVRTVEFQHRLLRTNGNAAPAEGDTASPHLTGQAIDLAKHGLSLTEIAWMRGYLLPLVQEGKVDVEEEFQQSCFHISVYKKYLPAAATPKRDLAANHHQPATALATAIR